MAIMWLTGLQPELLTQHPLSLYLVAGVHYSSFLHKGTSVVSTASWMEKIAHAVPCLLIAR